MVSDCARARESEPTHSAEEKPDRQYLCQCRFLHRAGARRSRHAGRRIRPAFCLRSRRRLDRAYSQEPRTRTGRFGRKRRTADRPPGPFVPIGLALMIVIRRSISAAGSASAWERGDISTSTVYETTPWSKPKRLSRRVANGSACDRSWRRIGHGDNMTVVEKRDPPCGVDVPVQVGGGIRDLDKAQRRIDAGAPRSISARCLWPKRSSLACDHHEFPDRVIAGIDVRGKHVATHGWQEKLADRSGCI